jgi:hypothetical protein
MLTEADEDDLQREDDVTGNGEVHHAHGVHRLWPHLVHVPRGSLGTGTGTAACGHRPLPPPRRSSCSGTHLCATAALALRRRCWCLLIARMRTVPHSLSAGPNCCLGPAHLGVDAVKVSACSLSVMCCCAHRGSSLARRQTCCKARCRRCGYMHRQGPCAQDPGGEALLPCLLWPLC